MALASLSQRPRGRIGPLAWPVRIVGREPHQPLLWLVPCPPPLPTRAMRRRGPQGLAPGDHSWACPGPRKPNGRDRFRDWPRENPQHRREDHHQGDEDGVGLGLSAAHVPDLPRMVARSCGVAARPLSTLPVEVLSFWFWIATQLLGICLANPTGLLCVCCSFAS